MLYIKIFRGLFLTLFCRFLYDKSDIKSNSVLPHCIVVTKYDYLESLLSHQFGQTVCILPQGELFTASLYITDNNLSIGINSQTKNTPRNKSCTNNEPDSVIAVGHKSNSGVRHQCTENTICSSSNVVRGQQTEPPKAHFAWKRTPSGAQEVIDVELSSTILTLSVFIYI